MIGPLLKGLGKTLEHYFKKPVTLQYPEERWTPYPRFRGRPRLLKDEEGKLICVACCLCQTVCPAQAIKIQPAEDEQGNRYPEKFELNLGRCIFCGFCVEACPKGAIATSHEYELADYTRESLIYDKEKLSK